MTSKSIHLAVDFFETDQPTAFDLYFKGMLFIAGEITLAFILAHFWHPAMCIAIFGGLAQSGVHITEAIKNYKLAN